MPASARRKEEAIQEQPVVLIISYQQTMRHLISQVCRYTGAQTVTVASEHEARTLAAREGLRAFSLVVMDTTAPAQDASWLTRMACQLLQEWTAASPLLPFVCIVPASQQHALLRIRADILRFVTIPVALPALVEVIESSLPRTTQRARDVSAPFDSEETSDHGHLYGQIHSVYQMVSAYISANPKTPEEVVKHD
jgi:DNA-binding NtrC family response regulator